jgi:hypothetical protein
MRPRPAQMAGQLGVGAAGVFRIQTSQEGHSTIIPAATTTASPASATSSVRLRMAYSGNQRCHLRFSRQIRLSTGVCLVLTTS